MAQYLYNCPEYLEGVFASFKAGLVPVNTNYRYTDSELQFLWRNADVEAVLFHASFTDRVERVRSSLPSVRLWISVTDGTESCPSWAVDYADLVAGPAGRCGPPYHRSGDDLYLLYTGGTTGAPKGVMWRQHDLFSYLNTGDGRPFPEDALIREGQRDRGRWTATGPFASLPAHARKWVIDRPACAQPRGDRRPRARPVL